MPACPLPSDEALRQRTLDDMNLVDTPAEHYLDTLVRLTQELAQVETVLISLIDQDRQWFKSCVGLDATETPRDVSFCGHAILQNEDTLEVIHDPYVETEKYVADAYAKTSSTSKQSGKNIVFYSCLEIYNSPAFDAFINSQDQYLQN